MAPATVLLIDSDYDSIAIYSMILEHHGFTVEHAFDPETGLRMAVESHPDVVISELFLPPIRGSNLVDHLRTDARTAMTPLIVLDSIPSFGGDVAKSLRGLSHLTKPCEPTTLLHEVQRLLAKALPDPH